MLAFIFGLFALFSAPEKSDTLESTTLQGIDSLKRPARNKVVLRDSTGRFLQVNRIFIVGNKITRDQIILRELTLKSGDIIYSLDLDNVLELDKKKLFNTRLFNTVNIRTLELQTDKIDILIDLDERWYTFPAPIFELSDRNFNEWWQNYNHDFRRVNYGVRLSQRNVRGRNETLRLVAQFGYVKRFELTYRFPYIDKKQKQGLTIDLDYSEAKNLAYQTVDHKLEYNLEKSPEVLRTTRGASIAYSYRPSFYESHLLSIGYRNVTISDTVVKYNGNYLGDERKNQQYTALSYQFSSDHRDYIAYPLKGYLLAGFITKSGLSPHEDLNKIEAGVTYSGHLELKNNFFFSNNSVVYWSAPTDVPYVNYGALGYRRQIVRGYEIYVIEGSYYFLNKTTFKKRIFSQTYHWGSMPIEQFRHIPLAIYLKTYGDLAYVNNYPNYTISSRLTNKILCGVGGGVDIVASYDVVLRFEYTFNAEGDKGFFFHIKKEF
jgi:outer membrane protein assembly factor BamA